MSGFLSRLCLYSMWTTFACLLTLREVLAQGLCTEGTTELRADGNLRLLSFPTDRVSNYPSNCERKWRITTGTGWVELHIIYMDIEGTISSNCIYDALTISKEYSYAGRQQIAKLCGSFGTVNRTITSSSNSLLLSFVSDGSIEKKGFQLYYFNGKANQELDSAILLTATYEDQYLTYPSSIDYYPDDADVSWRIMTTSPIQRLKIIIVSLDIEQGPNYCNYDSLTIYDGYNSDAQVLNKLCGKLNIRHRTIISTSQYLFLHFTSDSNAAGKGFRLIYTNGNSEATCNSDTDIVTSLIARDSNMDLTSPQYPNDYPANCLVQWRIRSTRGRVLFDVQTLDIEEDVDCTYDSLTFYDGYDDSSRILKKLCGNPNEDRSIFVSSSDVVFVRFKTDGYEEGTGFRVYFRAEDGTFEDDSGGNGSGNSAVIVGAIFGAVCVFILIVGLVFAIVRRKRNELRQQRLQQRAVDRALANSSTTNATTSSLPNGVYMISPSAPPPAYASLNHAYVHEEPPPSYSEANLYTTNIIAPPLYSNAVLNNVTAGQTSPAPLTGIDAMASFKEQDDNIYTNEPALEAHVENQATSLSQVPDIGQEPQPDYEHNSSAEQLTDPLGQEQHQEP